MRRSLALVLTLALSAGVGFAKGTSGGFGMFGPTLGLVNFDGLNTALAPYGATELKQMHLMFGGGGYGLVNNIVIGGSGWGGTQTVSSESLNLRCKVELSGGAFEIGYAVIGLKHLVIAPALGIGGSGYTLTLEPLTGDLRNFEELLQNPGRTSTLTFSQLTLMPELMINIPFAFAGIQLKAGYAWTPGNPSWQLGDGGKILAGPTVASGTPYGTLGITFGGFDRPAKKKLAPPPMPDDDDDDDDDDGDDGSGEPNED